MTDDDYGRRILGPLADEPPAPSRVDIAAAVTTGARRRRGRRAATTAAALAAGLAVASVPVLISRAAPNTPEVGAASGRPSASAAPSPSAAPKYDRTVPVALPASCTGEALPVPGGGQSHGSAVDPTGRYATYRTYTGGKQPIIWHEGKITKIGKPGADDSLGSINSHGVAVGFVWPKDGPRAVIASGKKSTRLPGGPAEARAINDHGVIVGATADEQPVRWRSRTEQPQRLPLPKGVTRGSAYDVDVDGTVVGYVEMPSGTSGRDGRTAYLWPAKGAGRVLERPTLPGHEFTYYDARQVSNGWVVGFAQSTNDLTAAVRWDLNTGKAEVFPDLYWGNDVNQYGWMVGMGKDQHAVLTDGVRTVRLPDVFPFPKEYGMNFAEAMSDDARTIIGNVDDGTRDNLQQAVLWHCS